MSALVVLSAAAWLIVGKAGPTSQQGRRNEIVAALGGWRPGGARLTGGFDFVAAGKGEAELDRRSLHRERAWLLELTARPGDTENLSQLALIELALGRIDIAVGRFELAVKLDGGRPQDLNDLAVASLARAIGSQPPRAIDLILALARVEEALAQDPSLLEGLFNRALLLELLYLEEAARAAWREYIQWDSGTPWGDEAARRLAALERAAGERWAVARDRLWATTQQGATATQESIVRRFPKASRVYAKRDLLGDWATQRAAGELADAAATLAVVRAIATARHALYNDRLLLDAVAVIDRALKAPVDRGRLAALIAGHRAYQQGLKAAEIHGLRTARPLLEQAREGLRRGGSPFAVRPDFRLAICDYNDGTYEKSNAALARLETLAEESSYRHLLARISWIRSLNFAALGQRSLAYSANREALARLEPLAEREDVAHLRGMLALHFHYLGETERAWEHMHVALAGLHDAQAPRRAYSGYLGAAQIALRQGEPLVALYFIDGAVASAREWGSTAALTESLRWRGRLLRWLGRREEARHDLKEARRYLAEVSAGDLSRRLEGGLAMLEGAIHLQDDPATAAEWLSKAIERYAGIGRGEQMEARLERARARRALGDYEGAHQDLAAGIALYEAGREGLVEEDFRISYFDRERHLFDEMISLQVAQRLDSQTALSYVERSRARTLLDLVDVSDSEGHSAGGRFRMDQPLDADAIRKRLPAGVVLISYALLENTLLSWVVADGRIDFYQQDVAQEEILGHVERLLARVRDEWPEVNAGNDPASRLYELLLRQQLVGIKPDSLLVVVPDRSLHRLPFAALRDHRGRYVIEDWTLAYTPSASLYLYALQRKETVAMRGSGESVLVIGDPAFDRKEHPLPRLSGAAEEAAEVAAIYDGTALIGRDATRRAFLERASGAEIVHLAAHAVAKDSAPLRSKLLLAPSDGEPEGGVVYAADVDAMTFDRTRLVVLSACRTAGGRIWRHEGVVSLARPFLASGVPEVIASLWDVADEATRELMVEVHRRLRAGEPPAVALRHAQLVLLRHEKTDYRAPSAWASFQVLGAAELTTMN